MSRPLTQRQRLFVLEYLKDLNATQSAIRAGYSEDTAGSIGHENLTKPEIKDAIDQALDDRARRTMISADMILIELHKLATVDLADAYDEKGNLKNVQDMPIDVRKAISGIKVFEEFEGVGRERTKIGETKELKFYDKKAALELLGRNLKLFSDKVEHTGKLTLEQLVAGSTEKEDEEK